MKKIVLFLVLMVLIALMCSCTSNKKSYKSLNTTEPDIKNEGELSIYTIDYETLESIPSVSLIEPDTSINAELIIKEVTANFHEEVSVEKVEENDDSVAVYFEEEKAPMVGVSEKMETAMLDCVAYSLMDNLEYCTKVFFRGSKGNYVSDNIELGYDEPYITE